MDRAIASGAIGREFESLRAHHTFPDPSTSSGFRLRAPAPLTPAKRLKFESLRAHHTFPDPSTSSGFRLRPFDFAQGSTSRVRSASARFPLRSRPQGVSSSNLAGHTRFPRSALREACNASSFPNSCRRSNSWKDGPKLAPMTSDGTFQRLRGPGWATMVGNRGRRAAKAAPECTFGRYLVGFGLPRFLPRKRMPRI